MVAPLSTTPGSDAQTAGALDSEAIALCQRLAGRLFPWDLNRALELALLKTFCLPSISGLLQRSGEFERRPRKRYDDTALMVAELLRHGPDSATGRAVIERLNRIHAHYPISQADYAYVLSGFVAEPIRWLERYGWRSLSEPERQALFRFWHHVGGLMGIEARPASLAELLALNERVEAELFRAAASNRRVADATLTMLAGSWPPPLQPLVRRLLQSLPEPDVSRSLGWPEGSAPLRRVIEAALRLRSRLANGWQRLAPPRQSRFYSQRPTPSYGATFQLQQLGPPALLERLNRPRWGGEQRRIGLTGGIASGKSSAGRLLAERHGLPLLDADVFAREALAPGSDGSRAVLRRYGERVRLRDPAEGAAIDRAALGRIVFADAGERRWLEQLVHPLVRQRFEAELERLAAAPAVVLVIPLLFEAGLEGLCSEVWLVDCDEAQQLERLVGRDGLSTAEAQRRIAAQWPLERKRALADVLIDNRGTAQALEERVAEALGTSLSP